MTLIISILMALGLIHKENDHFSMNKIKTTETYQKVYDKVGVDLDQNPQAWANVVKWRY